MKSRSRHLLYGLGIAGGVLFMLYAWLAWAPTGYESFERNHAAAARNLHMTLQEAAGSARDDSESSQGISDAARAMAPAADRAFSRSEAASRAVAQSPGPEPAAAPMAKDFFAALEDLRARSNNVFHSFGPGECRQVFYFAEIFDQSRMRLPISEAAGNNEAEPFTADDERILLAETACRLACRQRIKQWPGSDSSITRPADSISSEALHALADAAENILLSEWRIPDYADCPFITTTVNLAFQSASILAVARASLRGDGDKAARLLEIYLKFRCATYQAGDLDQTANSLDIAAALLPVEFDNFSSDGLGRAQKALDASILSPEEVKALAAAYAMRYRNESLRELRQQHVNMPQGTWLYLSMGVPRQAAWEFLRPVLVGQIERIALASAKGDTSVFVAERNKLTKMQSILASCDLPSPLWNTMPVWGRFWQPAQIIDFYNLHVNHLRMALAAARFERAEGRPPRIPKELVPLYLNSSALNSNLTFRLLEKGSYPAFTDHPSQNMYLNQLRNNLGALKSLPANAPPPANPQYAPQYISMNAGDSAPIALSGEDAASSEVLAWTPEKAVNAFWKKTGRLPVSHKDILGVLDHPAQAAQLGDSFEILEARIVFCGTNKIDRSNLPTAESIRAAIRQRYRIQATEEEKAELERRLPEFANSNNNLAAASVSAISLPLIDPKLVALLRPASPPLPPSQSSKGGQP